MLERLHAPRIARPRWGAAIRAPLSLACVALLPVLAAPTPGPAADHPGSSAACEECHTQGEGEPEAPKVTPEVPGFWAKLFGKDRAPQGHPSVSCAGVAQDDGTITGCHRPEDGRRAYLVVDLEAKPTDEFCGACHAEQRQPGQHHPSHKVDKDEDGIPETVTVPAGGQEIFSDYAPAAMADPVKSHPDALLFQRGPDGAQVRVVALPLETVTETVDGEPVTHTGVMTCVTCHNPHHGYLVEAGSEEELNRELVAREEGDALLRLRDTDNTLCDACH